MLFIIKPLMLIMVQWLPKDHNTTALIEIFETILSKLRSIEFIPMIVHRDPASMMTKLKEKVSTRINDVGTGSHVADAEVEIKIIKEVLSSSGLPFPVPLRFVKAHMYGAVGFKNTMLRKGETHSPREQYSGVKFDVAKHARAKFMCYCIRYRVPSVEK